jgi:hypothetical protein
VLDSPACDRNSEMTTIRFKSSSPARQRAPHRWLRSALAAPLAVLALAFTAASGDCKEPLSQYTYKDTKELVALVEDAASRIEAIGDDAFKEFAKTDPKWLNDNYYLFAYTLDGITLFQPFSPELIGTNDLDLKDERKADHQHEQPAEGKRRQRLGCSLGKTRSSSHQAGRRPMSAV